MIKKLPKDRTEFFRETGRSGGKLGGKRSLQTMTAKQRSGPPRKAAPASAQARRQRLPAVGPTRLDSYARKESRARKNFYRRDLNWMAEVLMRLEAGERDPSRPTGH